MEGIVDGIVAVLPGKFWKSLRNHTSHQVGGLFGGTLVVRFDIGRPWGLYKMHKTLWFCLMSGQTSWGSVVFVRWESPLQDEAPVCHNCSVVNGTSKFITVNVLWSLARAPEQLLHLPSAVLALIFVAKRIQPFLSIVDRESNLCLLMIQSFSTCWVLRSIF